MFENLKILCYYELFTDLKEAVVKYHFHRGFEYQKIILFLAKNHNYSISYSSLLRKLKQYGLSRRNLNGQDQVADIRKCIKEIVSGPGSAGGYRSVWHTLQLEGLRVPRIIAQHLLQEIDPRGVTTHKAHRLKGRVYRNPGPTYAWHTDGYNKLEPWGSQHMDALMASVGPYYGLKLHAQIICQRIQEGTM